MVPQTIPALLLAALSVGPSAAYELGQHAWRHRLLILAAPSSKDPAMAERLNQIHQRSEAVADRDLRVILLTGDGGLAADKVISEESATRLREQLGLTADERAMILIGKDGGIKREADLGTDLSEIFLQIDAMPMRRNEIRAKKDANLPVTPP